MSAIKIFHDRELPVFGDVDVSTDAAVALLEEMEDELLDRRVQRCTRRLRRLWRSGRTVKSTVSRRSRSGRLAAVVLFVLEKGYSRELVRQFLLSEEQRLLFSDRMRAFLTYPFWLLVVVLLAAGFGNALQSSYFADTRATWKDVLQTEEQQGALFDAVPVGVVLVAGVVAVLAPFAVWPRKAFDSDIAESCPVLGYDITLANDAAVCRLLGAVVRCGGDIIDACRLASVAAPTAVRREIFQAWYDAAKRGVAPVDVLREFPIFTEGVQNGLRFAVADGKMVDGFEMAVAQLEERVQADRRHFALLIVWLLCLGAVVLLILETLAIQMLSIFSLLQMLGG
ncbi:hypothetical protein JCM19992_19520 [Thermostilla marina]